MIISKSNGNIEEIKKDSISKFDGKIERLKNNNAVKLTRKNLFAIISLLMGIIMGISNDLLTYESIEERQVTVPFIFVKKIER